MQVALALHVLAVVSWVGGMAFALLILRPALAPLAPPQRLAVLGAVFARFLPVVGVAIVVIVATGGWMLVRLGGLRAAPIGVHAMTGLGAVMIVIYLVLVTALQPSLQAALRASDWSRAGAVAQRIRTLVGVNLVLGVAAIVAAVIGAVR